MNATADDHMSRVAMSWSITTKTAQPVFTAAAGALGCTPKPPGSVRWVTGQPRKGNLPVPVSGFVGRRREVARVRRLLEGNRLVTITGVGGVGKTRLALEVAAGIRSLPDGVWLVDLAVVTEPELVAAAVRDAVGLPDRSARSVLSTVVSFLQDKRLVLVLDNCEHVVDSCAVVVAKLLDAARGALVLATSRQPLWVTGEQVFALDPLSTPDLGQPPAGDLSEYESVRLFVERAQAVVPGFAVAAGNRAAVAAVCRRLDGIPLAIELAAARLRALSVEQVLARLDDRFQLLTSGPRTAPDRQRTLAAALAWSYDLCSVNERALWARASVFAGFDLAAAEAVCTGDGVDPDEVFDLVTGLLDKSVLVRANGTGAGARYRMLETVRQYGGRRLADSGQEDHASRRHREYFRTLAGRAEAEQVSPHEVAWLRRLLRELPNLRLAVESGLAEPNAAHDALRIAVAVQDLWLGAGRYQEGQRWLTRALAADRQPTTVRARGLALAGFLTTLLGDPTTGGQLLEQARALSDRLGDRATRAAVTLHRSSQILLTRPDGLADGLALIERALTDAVAAGDLRTQSLCHLQTATTLAFLGDPRALEQAERVRELGAEHGAQWTEAWGRLQLALVRWHRGEPERAVTPAGEALPLLGAVHDSWGAGAALSILAWGAARDRRYRYAARLLGACQAIRGGEGTPMAELGAFAAHHDQCGRATRAALGTAGYTAAFDEGAHFTLDEAIGYALGETGKPRPPGARTELTRREQEVAALVAEGLTNREIAGRLVISQRTAESHIEHILGKLGFTNRAQIATWIAGRR
jgi:predicted ATPase/DNA-binding CsgD family transcriptional regulator